jgi:CubicO group peptidase (beta-lactamase class C family)
MTNHLIGLGLGWLIVRFEECEDLILWHSGGTAGYQAYAGFMKARRLGIVVLANHRISIWETLTNQALFDVVGDRIFKVLLRLCSV